MASENLNTDDIPFRLSTEFRKGGVVVHHRGPSRWWERIIGAEEKWTRVRTLGSGSFGIVWLEESRIGQLRAVKRINMPPLDLKGKSGYPSFERELQTLIELREYEDLFVKFLGWYKHPEENLIYIAMEYLEHGDLGQYCKSFGTQAKTDVKEITKQILEGLVVLHKRHICHRDLKPENVLVASLSPIKVKIADFGVSKCANGTELRTQVGTLAYKAPELLGLVPATTTAYRRNEYTNAVDMWALGCLVHLILTTETPFTMKPPNSEAGASGSEVAVSNADYSQLDTDLLHAYCSGTVEFPIEAFQSQVTNRGVDFVKQLLDPNPRSRMSPEAALRHRWMSDLLDIFDSEDGCEILRRQFLALGIRLDAETAARIFLEYTRTSCLGVTAIAMIRHLSVKEFERLRNIAASKGYILILKMLLSLQPLPPVSDPCIDIDSMAGTFIKRTALQAAAESGHLEVVALLLEKGANVNAKPSPNYGRTALQAAAGSGHLEVVALLLDKGANVNAEPSSNYGRTALQAVADSGHLEVVALLLDKGADVNAEPSPANGRTALQAAADSGHLGVVTLLLGKGANANAEKPYFSSRTALQAAAEGRHFEVKELLLKKGAKG